MGFYDRVIQLDAEAGAIGNCDVSIDEQLTGLQHLGPPADLAPLQLEQTKILQHGADLHARRRRNWPARVVRRDFDAIGFGHRRNARELEQADSGYNASVGPRAEYQAGYREAFRRGYREGFGVR